MVTDIIVDHSCYTEMRMSDQFTILAGYSTILVSCTVTILHATAVIFLLSLISVIVDHNFMRYFSMHGWCFCRPLSLLFLCTSPHDSCYIYFFFDCRYAVSLEGCSVFRFFQACLIFIGMAFSATRPFDDASSIPQQVRSCCFIDEFCFGSLWPRRPCFARALWR